MDDFEWMNEIAKIAGVGKNAVSIIEDLNGHPFGAYAESGRIYVTQGLCDVLTRNQIAMVVLHESVHVIERHGRWRELLTPLPFWFCFCAGLHSHFFAMIAVGLVMSFVLHRLLSHRQERRADCLACNLSVAISLMIEDVPESARKAARNLIDVFEICGGDPNRATWTHPSVRRRTNWLEKQRYT